MRAIPCTLGACVSSIQPAVLPGDVVEFERCIKAFVELRLLGGLRISARHLDRDYSRVLGYTPDVSSTLPSALSVAKDPNSN